MKRVATTTVIRGNGACEAYMNGIIKEEIKKLNERHRNELQAKEAELSAARGHLNKVLSHSLNTLEVYNVKKKSIFARIRDSIEILWCKIWGLGVVLGLWEYVGDKET